MSTIETGISIENLPMLPKVSVLESSELYILERHVCIDDLHVTQVSVLSVYVSVCIREVDIAEVSV